MIQPGGGANGPYIENNTSACGDKTYTDLTPGRDGGLSTMGYQPQANPPFDASGSGTSDRITLPKDFFGAKFATATNTKDPQTGKDVPGPSITSDGAGNLSGDLRAFAASYQGQHFNQGAPKPDGSTPGLTGGPGGTYDQATKRFALEWKSTIVGGPFNNFTGVWHLEGVFQPGVSATEVAPSGSSSPAATPAIVGNGAPARLTAAQTGGEQLQGLFRLTAASCSAAQVSGSYFRMIQPGGSYASGPFLSNNSSTCADTSYTDLTPGKDGGLSTTAYQPQPNPPFDGNGGTNDKITLPKGFFGANFATATNQTDPQMNLTTALPVITHDGAGKLSGDLRAFAAAYQGQHFNQGAPKPDGSMPGATTLLSGTYDKATKKFSFEWASTIVGGPFNNFTGKWHFEGTFEPVGATPPVTTPTTGTKATTTTAPVGGSGSATTGGARVGVVGGARHDGTDGRGDGPDRPHHTARPAGRPARSRSDQSAPRSAPTSRPAKPAHHDAWEAAMTTTSSVKTTQQRLDDARSAAAARKATLAAAGGRRGLIVAVLVIGVGLLAAPFVFQMLALDNRAPRGGEMIDQFRPYMTDARITKFDGFMDQIDRAEQSYKADLRPAVASAPRNPAQQAALDSVDNWAERWEGDEGIFADMTGILARVRRNLDNYAAVDNLPPFKLFPFFFILPGLIVAGLARATLRRMRRGLGTGGPGKALVVMGVGLIAAPFIFQMMGGENRAFEGNGMINDFKPIMTSQRVGAVQGYFPVIALAEGQIRNELLPLTKAQPSNAPTPPVIAEFSEQWPGISSEFAQFLGVMSDNLDNFAAVKALPPFALFPFFFIIPGLLVAGLTLAAGRRPSPA